jgi:uncharacterized membrane protein (Fun14 family)
MRPDAESVPDAEPAEAVVGAGVVTTGVVGWAVGVAVTVVVEVTGTFEVAVTVTLGRAGAVTLGRAGAVTLGTAVTVAVLLGKLPTPLLTALPQPANRQPTARMAAGRERPFAEHRMLSPSHR